MANVHNSDSPSIEDIRALFENDRFATGAGCTIIEAQRGFARCEMVLTDSHRNAMGNVMGGAVFTLADFALAVACNIGENPTVSIQNDIRFMRSTRGTKLIATAKTDKSGRTVGFYTVDIDDDLGERIATMAATCSRKA